MSAVAPTSMMSHVLRLLPGPLLRALDAWSQRVARRRREQRQQKWRQARAASTAPDSTIAYPLKPWRD